MILAKKFKACCLGLAAALALSVTMGCGGSEPAAQQNAAVPVKAIKALQTNATLNYEYAGQVYPKNEVEVKANVSGKLVEKFVNGGDIVSKGQPLFRLDRREFESTLLSAQANLAQAQANLANSQRDTERYRELYKENAIAEQLLTSQESSTAQQQAIVEANAALMQKAQDDLNDTLVVSPVDGRMDVNDISVGTYVSVGNTVMAKVSSTDPIFVQFNMSENEYLKVVRASGGKTMDEWGQNIKLTLSDGSTYPFEGRIEQVDKGLADNSGTLTLKAAFENPDQLLIPGMFGRIQIAGEVLQNAILVPQRSVLPLLEKSFVTVVTPEGKAKSREVKLGEKIGSFWIVTEGIEAGDTVVVEGLTKIQDGIDLNVTEVTPQEMNLSL